MQKLNKIQKINLELKNYVNRIKAQTLLHNKDESANLISNNLLTTSSSFNLVASKEDRLNFNSKGGANIFISNNIGTRINSYKKPMYLISKKIHKHIRSLVKFNTDLAHNNTISYNFYSNNKKFNINSILSHSFLNLGNIISKPVILFSPNQITINLFYYVLQSEKGYNLINESENLEYLCSFLSNKLKKNVKIELIRLHHPALESQILANTIGFISNNKKVRFRSIITSLYNNTQIIKLNESALKDSNLNYCRPTALIGIKVRLGGRILSQKIVPRFTTFNKQKGAFARIKSDFTTQSRFTNKSRRGAFSYTVTIAHKSF